MEAWQRKAVSLVRGVERGLRGYRDALDKAIELVPGSYSRDTVKRLLAEADVDLVKAARQVGDAAHVLASGPYIPVKAVGRLSVKEHRALRLYHLGGIEAWRTGPKTGWVHTGTVSSLMRKGHFSKSGLTAKGRAYIEEHVAQKAIGRRFRPGDRVRITGGQYEGQLGRVVAISQGYAELVVDVDNVGRRSISGRRLEPWGGDAP